MKPSALKLLPLERDFINSYQGYFPLEERPFRRMADKLNCHENELIDTVNKLKTENTLTRFGPLYDAARLGGGLTLAAIAVPEEQYEIITVLVNGYPEVAHNYRREHELNMWFVLATETPIELTHTISSIEKATGLKVFNFPKQEEFYIGLWLNLLDDGSVTTLPVPDQTDNKSERYTLDDIDRKLISVTQAGFTIERSPYQTIASDIGLTQSDVLLRLKSMLDCSIIRRIGAVPNHYRLGLKANGMTVWDVEDDTVIELGNIIGQLDFVSHCYQRPRHLPVWRYNLFAMVHGHSRDEVNLKVKQIKSILGNKCKTHDTLFSSAILKKTGLRLAA